MELREKDECENGAKKFDSSLPPSSDGWNERQNLFLRHLILILFSVFVLFMHVFDTKPCYVCTVSKYGQIEFE